MQRACSLVLMKRIAGLFDFSPDKHSELLRLFPEIPTYYSSDRRIEATQLSRDDEYYSMASSVVSNKPRGGSDSQ